MMMPNNCVTAQKREKRHQIFIAATNQMNQWFPAVVLVSVVSPFYLKIVFIDLVSRSKTYEKEKFAGAFLQIDIDDAFDFVFFICFIRWECIWFIARRYGRNGVSVGEWLQQMRRYIKVVETCRIRNLDLTIRELQERITLLSVRKLWRRWFGVLGKYNISTASWGCFKTWFP